MLQELSGSDWKIFRQLQEVALERLCERVLSNVNRLTSDASMSARERYLALFDLLKQQEREIAIGFNDPCRSTAVQQLLFIKSRDLLTEDELARFSSETRDFLEALIRIPQR